MKAKLNDFLPDASAPDSATVVAGMQAEGDFRMIRPEDIRLLFKPREQFSHKGTYGHALIIAGAPQTMGAALLCAMACLHAGAGLTTAAIPESGLTALNTLLPEVMYIDKKDLGQGKAFKHYDAIAIGPGLFPDIGSSLTDLVLVEAVQASKMPVVADADMLTLLAKSKQHFRHLAKDSILTPHMKEFDRLFGMQENWWARIQTAVIQARKRKITIVLKNRYTFVIDTGGTVYINPTGNPAMAQGGMGDVLTGIITAYTAQKYIARDAAVLGCYFHGLAGDQLAEGSFNVSASRLALQLPKTVKAFFG
ncbi:NAD(P)H-hydrate dehydratase [Pedobacter ginsengisoli]|uniref:NAD(P)H-hydrate dehydratase n=1 Tax=Pedobacter ginsengisoli TaxID=363852 RepID=UPI0025512E5D|nr:NAD(P)H-hydrate dehydratase [Pedobacter ginsengisoli]